MKYTAIEYILIASLFAAFLFGSFPYYEAHLAAQAIEHQEMRTSL